MPAECPHTQAVAALRAVQDTACGWVECSCGVKLRNAPPPPEGAEKAEDTDGAPEPQTSIPDPLPLQQSGAGDPEKALSNLARWLPVIEGRAAGLEPTIRGTRDGRSDHVDEHHRDLRAAYATLDRLAGTPKLHRRVLLFAYGWMGPQTRAGWDGRGDETKRIEKPLWDGVDARLALVFAAPPQRLAWLMNPAVSMAKAAMVAAGRQMRQHALQAFQQATPVSTDGSWLADDRDWITRAVRECDAAARTLNATREQNRCAPPTRAERRKSLQPTKSAVTAVTEAPKLDIGGNGIHPLESSSPRCS